jgi:hypothetical protein
MGGRSVPPGLCAFVDSVRVDRQKRRMMKTLLALLAAVTLLTSVPSFAAEPTPVALGDRQGIATLLKARVGAPVQLMLRGGGEVGGTVVKVGDDAVHVGQLTGKDFYDAVVALDAIAAVVVRVR